MQRTLKILLVEDYDSVGIGVKDTLLKSELNCQVVLCDNADDAYGLIKKQSFDIVLLDLILKSKRQEAILMDGDDLLKQLRKQDNCPKIIVHSKIDQLSMLDYVINALDADGYILKSRTSLSEFVPAIKTVMVNRKYLSPSVDISLTRNHLLLDVDYIDRMLLVGLSRGLRQNELAPYMDGKEISITLSAIEKRIKKLKERFNAETTIQMVAQAIKEGIIES